MSLISERNNYQYSYDESVAPSDEPNLVGTRILEIWNQRVRLVRQEGKFLRTVVLIRSDDLRTFKVFEFETIVYLSENFSWQWNSRNNLDGYNKVSGKKKFRWQINGQQFTIFEDVPAEARAFQIKVPAVPPLEETLSAIGYSDDWITVLA